MKFMRTKNPKQQRERAHNNCCDILKTVSADLLFALMYLMQDRFRILMNIKLSMNSGENI